ncbi:MFS family permease [Sphingomonas vulcanisoli]|uniref:MFS family permease n=1 Tax=Sphingomonas vulcanisoli TaxID=1658060 RepID=A0ABX0TQV2_9SPHN|nr:MFS transporter [Sphingomonas vulcanisoli]NIJ06529.1 MFS family permease [Sphingomonas vulcanisoli]
MSQAPARPRAFAAMRHPQFRWYFGTFLLAMMADNIEHVISYWVMFQKFHSPALGGFAVVSHWLPYILFSIPMGGLADRVKPQRLIQISMILFIGVSLGWGFFFATDTLKIWEAMLLLVVHGCAGVFWQTPGQLILYSIVDREELQSAVRLNATARYLGVLVGPAVGGVLLIWLGPVKGIFVNCCFYLPTLLWMARVRFQREAVAPRAMSGLKDVLGTFRAIADRPAIVAMAVLAAAASGLIGNSYQAQMPEFAVSLGHGNPGFAYSALLAADAAGALTGGFLLETLGGFRTGPRNALLLAGGWCLALAAFALTGTYAVALLCLFAAGFFELSFSSMAQTVVQVDAPSEMRGRVLGVYAMAALGCRTFSGITVGLIGALLGVHISLALAAAVLFAVVGILLARQMRGRALREAPLS